MRKILFLFVAAAACCGAQTAFADRVVEVLAIEYAPFTTKLHSQGGIAFEKLIAHSADSSVTWKPLFVPPARAALMIKQQEWCASFYPASSGGGEFKTIQLTKEKVTLGIVRQREEAPFSWQSLEQLGGNTLALLRTNDDSPFLDQFVDAGLTPVFVETVESAISMLLLGRVDMAFSDNMTFAALDTDVKRQLQFSDTPLRTLPITLFVNQTCEQQLEGVLF